MPAGGRTTRDVALSAEIYRMEPFTVSGPREGSAAAITQQREATNLKTRYSLSRRTAVFCDVENLNRSHLSHTYAVRKDRVIETRLVAMKIVGGVSGRF